MQAILARRKEATPDGLVYLAGEIAFAFDGVAPAAGITSTTTMYIDEAFVFPSTTDAQAAADFINPRRVGGEAFHVFPWIGEEADADAILVKALRSSMGSAGSEEE